MLSLWDRRFTWVVAVGLFGALVGCAPPVINTRPDTFEVPPEAAKFLNAGGKVALKNAYPSETNVKIFTMGQSGWTADMKQYTDTAIIMLGREMGKKGVVIEPSAPKTITLRVHDVSASPGWTIRSYMSLEATYGDGTKSAIRAENSSPSDAWRSVDGTLMIAVSRLLGDEKFIAYVNK